MTSTEYSRAGAVGARRTRPRHGRAALLGALLSSLALTVLVVGSAPASAFTRSDRQEQFRYAYETVNLTYKQFLDRKADFQRSRCRKENYTYHGAPTPGCTKPSPYNAFNWTDDGCSGREQIGVLSLFYRNLFNEPCQLHDFGYRNLGEGLTLDRTEKTRKFIDDRFLTEMNRLCDGKYRGLILYKENADCKSKAEIVHGVVRRASNWNGPPQVKPDPVTADPQPKPQPKPQPNPPGQPSPTRPVFAVMNTSETLPDGVWFRDDPRVSGPKLNGYGVYAGDRVQLQCHGWGESLGSFRNRLWYRSVNLTRPSAPGRANVGWLNAHYVNDGKGANVAADGVPAC